jgi:hypothetical protein
MPAFTAGWSSSPSRGLRRHPFEPAPDAPLVSDYPNHPRRVRIAAVAASPPVHQLLHAAPQAARPR